MSARLIGSSVSWKSNDCLCILSPSVASIRLTEDIYLHRVKGCGEEEEGSSKERKKKREGDGIKGRAS